VYIKSLKLTNFQSHKNTKIEFTNGLNAIIGASNVGKSSCVRALRFVLCNEQIEDFITQGEKNCEVEVEFDNNIQIIRGRKGKENYYTIINADGIEETFTNFGREVPAKVKQLTGAVELVIDSDKSLMLNIIGQHNPYFLLGESDNLKNKSINSLADVHYVDSAIRDIKNDADKETKSVLDLQKEKTELEENIKTIPDTTTEKQKIEDIEKEIIRYENLSVTLKNISEIQNRFQTIEEKEKRLENIPAISEVLPFVERFRDSVDRWKNLIELGEKWDNIVDKETSFEQVVAKLCGFKPDLVDIFKKKVEQLKKLNDLLNQFNAYEIKQTQYDIKYDKLKDFKKEDVEHYKFVLEQLKSFNDLLEKLNNFNMRYLTNKRNIDKLTIDVQTTKTDYVSTLVSLGVCPLCMTPLDEHKITDVIGRI